MNNSTEYHPTLSKKLEQLLGQIAFFSLPYLPLRYHLYQSGFFNRARVPIPTISIGNLALGGVGKTPFVIWLLERLQDFKIAVLHSGYGGGDEGRMLQAKFPKAFIWADKKCHLGLQQAYALTTS